MEPIEKIDERVCRCSQCRDIERDLALGTVELLRVYGDSCANVGFSLRITRTNPAGSCRRFELLPRRRGMDLSHRKLGHIREGGQALLVGGAFVCEDFRPFHCEVAP
jgi:hypothetical protein